MGDIVEIVEFGRVGQRPRKLLDLQDPTGVARVFSRGTWQISQGSRQFASAPLPGSRGGSVQVPLTDAENATLSVTVVARGQIDDAIARVRELAEVLDGVWTGPNRAVRWRPDGAGSDRYLRILGRATIAPAYQWVRASQDGGVEVPITVPIAPIADLPCVDVFEDFTDPRTTLTDWTIDSGSGLSVGATGLAAATTGVRVLRHTGRPWLVGDHEQTLVVDFTTAPGTARTGFILGTFANGNQYLALWTGTQFITAIRTPAGVVTDDIVAGLPFTIGPGRWYFRAARCGQQITYEVTDDAFAASPGTSYGEQYITTAFVDGTVGLYLNVGDTGWRYRRWERRGYAYRGSLERIPHRVRNAPGGGVPSAAELRYEGGDYAINARGALVGWWRRPQGVNLVTRGGFRAGIDGWTSQPAGGTGATIATDPAGMLLDAGSGQPGARLLINRFLRQGTEYKLRVRGRAVSTSTTITAKLTTSGADPQASATFTTARTELVVTFAADSTGIRETTQIDIWDSSGVNGRDVIIESVELYEADSPPAADTGPYLGYGALPPFGVFPGDFDDAPRRVNAAPVAARTLHDGNVANHLLGTTACAPGTEYAAEYVIDPALADRADAPSDTVSMEVWAFLLMDKDIPSIRMNVGALREGAAAPSAYTREYGSAGRTVARSITVAEAIVPVRVGTIDLPYDPVNRTRWALRVSMTPSAGSSGPLCIADLIAVPARQRMAGQTAVRAALVENWGHPDGDPDTNAYRRVIERDGRSTREITPYPPARVTGPAGVPIELDDGDSEILVRTWHNVPDSDDVVTQTDRRWGETLAMSVSLTPRALI